MPYSHSQKFYFCLILLTWGAGLISFLGHTSFLGFWAGVVITFVLYGLAGINVIKEWLRRPVLFFGGKYSGTYGPGIVWIEPISLWPLRYDVPVQDIVTPVTLEAVRTKDDVPLYIEATVTTRVDEDHVREYVVEVDDPETAMPQRVKAALRETVGAFTLFEVQHGIGMSGQEVSPGKSSDTFAQKALESIREKVKRWGMQVSAIEIVDLKIIDEEMAKAIAQKPIAIAEAAAQLERATAQEAIAAALNKAAAILTPGAMELKRLDTLLVMAESGQNNTVILPSPVGNALQDSLLANLVAPKASAIPVLAAPTSTTPPAAA